MVKKIAASVLALTMIMGTGVMTSVNFLPDTAITASADHVYGDFQFKVNRDNTAVITGYTGTSTSVSVPSKIVGGMYDGAKVVGINQSAFRKNTKITSVKLPDTVTEIVTGSFSGCTNLQSVTLSKNMTQIPVYAFEKCSSLKSIAIPDKVANISSNAFYKCTSLSSVTFGSGVTTIEKEAFRGCTALTSVSLPNSLKTLGLGAFTDCTKLKTAKFGSNIKSIPTEAFKNCTGLETVTIPGNVTGIGSGAFNGCTSLKNLTISDGVISINTNAFYNCKSLKSITIPKSVTKIYSKAFGYDENNKKISGVKIYCYKGTAGEQYALDNGIPYEYIKASEYPGNINGDSRIDIADVSALMNHLNGVKSLTSAQLKRADVDGSGTVDIQDVSKIVNHINGIRSLF